MVAYSKVSGALADPLMIRDHHCASPDLLRAVSGPHRRRYGINMLVSDFKALTHDRFHRLASRNLYAKAASIRVPTHSPHAPKVSYIRGK